MTFMAPIIADRRRWGLRFASASLIAGLSMYALPVTWIVRARAGLCPASAFLISPYPGSIASIYGPAFLAAMPAGLLFTIAAFVRLDAPAARWAATFGGGRAPVHMLRSWLTITAVTVVLAVPLTWRSVHAASCAAPEGVSQRSGASDSLRAFGWSQVAQVTAGCRVGRGVISGHITFLMDDGTVLEFRGVNLSAAYRALERSLSGQTFTFDNTGRARCEGADAALLARAPGT